LKTSKIIEKNKQVLEESENSLVELERKSAGVHLAHCALLQAFDLFDDGEDDDVEEIRELYKGMVDKLLA
jgi:hypothetical protein